MMKGNQMEHRTLILDELKEMTLDEVLRKVIERQEVLTVRLPEGESVLIRPTPRLRPLPVLEGFVPDGWKVAVYE